MDILKLSYPDEIQKDFRYKFSYQYFINKNDKAINELRKLVEIEIISKAIYLQEFGYITKENNAKWILLLPNVTNKEVIKNFFTNLKDDILKSSSSDINIYEIVATIYETINKIHLDEYPKLNYLFYYILSLNANNYKNTRTFPSLYKSYEISKKHNLETENVKIDIPNIYSLINDVLPISNDNILSNTENCKIMIEKQTFDNLIIKFLRKFQEFIINGNFNMLYDIFNILFNFKKDNILNLIDKCSNDHICFLYSYESKKFLQDIYNKDYLIIISLDKIEREDKKCILNLEDVKMIKSNKEFNNKMKFYLFKNKKYLNELKNIILLFEVNFLQDNEIYNDVIVKCCHHPPPHPS